MRTLAGFGVWLGVAIGVYLGVGRKNTQLCIPVRRILLLCTAILGAACEGRRPEFGVSVFANDTIPVLFTLELTGGLSMGIRAQAFDPGPNKSLIMTTPAQLTVQSGEGTATITSQKGGALIVQPLGVMPDSGDTSSVLGSVVKLTRAGTQRSVKLTVEKQ